MSLQVPKSAKTSIYGTILDDKCDHPDVSIPTKDSTTVQAQSIDHSTGDGDEIHPPIAIPSGVPSSTSSLHSSRASDALYRDDSRTGVSIAPATVEHSIKDEDHHHIPIQREEPHPSPELSSNDRGDEVVQSSEDKHGVDPDSLLPTEAPRVTIEPGSVICRDGDIGNEEVPSTSLFQASSNSQISNTDINAIGDNATIIQFGDGQFTEIQRDLICDYIANLRTVTVVPDINNNLKKHALTQSIKSLPRVNAVFDDYHNKKKSGPCFKGTREALLREMADWATTSCAESRMYILSGLVGSGKSTVAYTIASRAADLNLLGASFFFSRDDADCKNAKKFFTTIAYQLCVYNETFAKAIGDVLLTERGSAATIMDPQNQLLVLILEPLRSIAKSDSRPILIVVDALDECDEEDAISVLAGLSQLVRDLPSFRIILTTRPQPHLDRFLCNQDGHKIFRLQDTEDKVVDGDIRLYLNHCLSLEAVQERYPRQQWCASGEEIDSLVRAAGRLFVIASTAVRYIFDKSASNPAAQMQRLLSAFAQAYTPLKDLDLLYTVILRDVIPENCDDHIIGRYQSVVGAIIFVQQPLPVSTLSHLININMDEIHAVLNNLQSVISLGGGDVPRIFHKSFPDYLTDQTRCKDPHLRIDTRIRHTQIATCCFEIMHKYLKRNILSLGDPARFMSNTDGFRVDGITNEQLEEKVPQQLRYACVFWVNHLDTANIGDADLMNGLKRFVDEHILHWFEVLSLIGKLDLAHHAIGVILKVLKSRSSDLHKLLSDALCFVGRFYELIKRSALYLYHSALPFTPSDSLLYRRYIKDAVDNLFSIEGGPEKWDALAASMSHGEAVDIIKFSLNNTLFVSCSARKSKICDAVTGTPVSTIPGHRFAVANDFSTIASSEDKTITLYNVNGSKRDTTFTTSSGIYKLAFSSESSRLAAALTDGTVWLWESSNAEFIDCFDGLGVRCYRLQFSSTGARLAYTLANGIKLRDGKTGEFIGNLRCGSSRMFEFSGDGSRIASVSFDDSLTLWNSESGAFIADVKNVGWRCLAISAKGSLLATADNDNVKLWSENRKRLAQIKVLEIGSTQLMVFSPDNILAIGTKSDIKLYNVKTHSFIRTLPLGGASITLAFSPDGARLAAGDAGGNVNFWDIRGVDASGPPSKENATAVTAMALSRDCSRLACGFGDGAVELWETRPIMRRIDPLTLQSQMEAIISRIFRQSRHTKSVWALGFDPDGRLFASGSDDGTIKLWNSEDGALRGTLKAPGRVQAVALSNNVLVAAGYGGVTLWSPDTLSLIHTFETHQRVLSLLAIADDSTLIAVFSRRGHVALLDVVNHTTITTFDVPFNVHTMSFLSDNLQLVVQSDQGAFLSLDLINKRIMKEHAFDHLIQLPNTPLSHDVPIWHCQDKEQHYFAALFSQHKSPVPVLWIPKQIPVMTWTQGSSMIALGCRDGRIILLRLPTSHVN